ALADPDRRAGRLDVRRVLPRGLERRVSRSRADDTARCGRERVAGACRDRAPRVASGRGRALRSRPLGAVPRRLDLVRVLDRVAPADANALPGGTRPCCTHAPPPGARVLLAVA